MFKPMRDWPVVYRHPSALSELSGSVRGLDLEWDTKNRNITILGMSDTERAASVGYEAGRPHLLAAIERPEVIFVGHNIIDADREELANDGIQLPLERCKDTILLFYLTNSSLCKTTKKSSLADEEGDRKGVGYMNLGAMLSMYTDLPRHKECRQVEQIVERVVDTGLLYKTGKKKGLPKTKKTKERTVIVPCVGPCPEHDVFGYNGIDALGPVLALPGLERHAKLRGVEHLYPLHAKLAELLARMKKRGVQVDVPYIEKLRAEFGEMKKVYWNSETKSGSLPFNPESPKQVKAYFGARKIDLDDAREQTIRDAVEESPACAELGQLLEYKELGDGPDRWFGPKFLKDGFIHPHLGFYTSSGRLMCAGPNLQNVAKRRIDRKTGEKIGKKVRRAIVAPDGYYLYRADYKNAENLVYLYLAGYDIGELKNVDLHDRMRVLLNISEDHPFSLALGGARDAAKSTTHANHYLEGLSLATVVTKKMLEEERVGSRIIFRDWRAWGKTVTFTGINLARRAFGDSSTENRRRALEVQKMYYQAFPKVRELQQRITAQVERENAVRPPHAYYLASYGFPEDRLKTAAAVWGSQPVAHFTKLALLRAEEHPNLQPLLQVHDEILFLADCRHDPKQVADWIREAMTFETSEMPGFSLRADVSFGENWSDQKEIE